MDSQQTSQQPPPLVPPSVPPRPSRVKTPATKAAVEGETTVASDGFSAAAGTTEVPVIPPRPSRNKSPLPPAAAEESNIDRVNFVSQPPLPPRQSTPPPAEEGVQAPSDIEPEPASKTTATIPSDMEVHAPIARPTGAVPSNRPDFLRSTSLGTSTPPRQHPKSSNDVGIPEIGKQVPMYPNAGDVQAPTPNPSRQASALPAHAKKGPRSASPYVAKKEDYGEYGSGLHPLERRSGHYSMSSEDLNQIVAQTATPTTGNFPGVPEEELGYLASEEYAKAMGTATPREELTEAEANKLHKVISGEGTQTREGSQSPELTIHIQPRGHERSGSHPYGRHNLPGKFSQSQTSLAVSSLVETKDLPEDQEYGFKNGEFRDEHYSGTPILASDEITKRGGTSTPHHHPAVSPPLGPRRTGSKPTSRAPSRPPSRGAMKEAAPEPLPDLEEHEPLFPDDDDVKDSQTALREGVEKAFAGRTSRSSRKFPSNDIWEDAPPSSHLSATVASPPPGLSPIGIDAIVSGDQRASGEEPQDEESDRLGVPNRHKKTQSPDNRQSKPVRPAVLAKTASGKQRFPSKDIWEEAPDSAQLTATVSPTPANEESQSPVDTTAPEVNFPSNPDSTRATTGAPLGGSSTHVNPDNRASTTTPLDNKPELPPRPESPEKKERWGPTGAVPLVPSSRPPPRTAKIPTKFDSGEQIEQAQRPSSVPHTSSPESPTEKKPSPAVPERPNRPIVPQRPVKIAAKFQQSPLSQSEEASPSVKAPPPVKPKPAIGGKIAALKANLALEQKLAAGPLAFKKKEEEEKLEAATDEPKPLVEDVRKSRAKGPRGRKLPTAAAAAVPEDEKGQEEEDKEAEAPAPALSFMIAKTVWTIDDEDDARVVLQEAEQSSPKKEEGVVRETETEKSVEATESNTDAEESLAKQVLAEMVDPPVVVDKPSQKEPSHQVNTGMISSDLHPEDAAPKGQSSLDIEKPAHTPAEQESIQAEAERAVEEEGDGDWDVVNKV